MTDSERARHMTPADAHVYALQINALLHDLEGWQARHPHIVDYRSTGMIQSLAEAARNADLLVREAMDPRTPAAMETFRVNVLGMDPEAAADLRVKETAATNARLDSPYPADLSAGN